MRIRWIQAESSFLLQTVKWTSPIKDDFIYLFIYLSVPSTALGSNKKKNTSREAVMYLNILNFLFCRELAQEQGYQMVKVDCTSHISALAVSRLGFERIHVLKYAEHFQDDETRPVFNPPPPHWGVQVYIYKLDEL